MQLKEIPINQIEENPWNPNIMTENQLEHLKKEYKRVGYLQPIVVRKKGKKYEIVDGAHRFRAYKVLNLSEISAVIVEMNDENAKLTSLNLNKIKGENDPIKMAELLSELKQTMDNKVIADILQMNEKEIDAFDILLSLPEEVEEFVQNRENMEVYRLLLTEEQNEIFIKALKYTGIQNVTLAVMDIVEQYVYWKENKKLKEDSNG